MHMQQPRKREEQQRTRQSQTRKRESFMGAIAHQGVSVVQNTRVHVGFRLQYEARGGDHDEHHHAD